MTSYIDEAGYTSENPLNPEQAVFAQVPHDFTDSETGSLLGAVFSGVIATDSISSHLIRNHRTTL